MKLLPKDTGNTILRGEESEIVPPGACTYVVWQLQFGVVVKSESPLAHADAHEFNNRGRGHN